MRKKNTQSKDERRKTRKDIKSGKRIEVKAKRRKRKFMEKKYQGRGRTEGEFSSRKRKPKDEEEKKDWLINKSPRYRQVKSQDLSN